MTDKHSTTLPATVEKIIKSPSPSEPEKAQISVEGADHLYKELRIESCRAMEIKFLSVQTVIAGHIDVGSGDQEMQQGKRQ